MRGMGIVMCIAMLCSLGAACAAPLQYNPTAAQDAILAFEAARRGETVAQTLQRLVDEQLERIDRERKHSRSQEVQRAFERASETDKQETERVLRLR